MNLKLLQSKKFIFKVNFILKNKSLFLKVYLQKNWNELILHTVLEQKETFQCQKECNMYIFHKSFLIYNASLVSQKKWQVQFHHNLKENHERLIKDWIMSYILNDYNYFFEWPMFFIIFIEMSSMDELRITEENQTRPSSLSTTHNNNMAPHLVS